MEDFNLLDSEAVEIRERYLWEIQERLGTYRSARDTYETISEMRNHLNAMAQAHMDLGIESLESMGHAVRHFGSAEAVASSLLKSYQNPKHSVKKWGDTAWLCGILGGIAMGIYLIALDPGNRVQRDFAAWEIQILLGAFGGAYLGLIALLTRISIWRFATLTAVCGSLLCYAVAGSSLCGPLEFGTLFFLALGTSLVAKLNRDTAGQFLIWPNLRRFLARC